MRPPVRLKTVYESDYARFRNEVAPHGGFVARNLRKSRSRGSDAAGSIGFYINPVFQIGHGGAFLCDSGIPNAIADERDRTENERSDKMDERRSHGARVTAMVKAILVSFAYAETGKSAASANGAF